MPGLPPVDIVVSNHLLKVRFCKLQFCTFYFAVRYLFKPGEFVKWVDLCDFVGGCFAVGSLRYVAFSADLHCGRDQTSVFQIESIVFDLALVNLFDHLPCNFYTFIEIQSAIAIFCFLNMNRLLSNAKDKGWRRDSSRNIYPGSVGCSLEQWLLINQGELPCAAGPLTPALSH